MANLKFYGASRMVTGSCYLLEAGGLKILIDCGMFQGSKSLKERNYGDFPFSPASIDYLILTHAHIDHSGLIPKLCKNGFQGQVITTKATAELASVMLPDSGYIQEMEVERKNRKYARAGKPLIKPIYTAEDARECLKFFKTVEYNQQLSLSPEITLRFQDAGHILGSAMAEIWVKEHNNEFKIVFSGDIGNYNQPIIRDPATILEADYVVMESTYGNRLHEHNEDKLDMLTGIIKETFSRGGNLIIPAFAIERTQDLLYDLNILLQRGAISPQEIYIDSPLAIAATEIFCRNTAYYDEDTIRLQEAKGDCPLYFPGLHYTMTTEESIALNKIKGGAIIISASGMCDAGRIKHHLKHNLWRPESTILFVGYQAQGTLGRRILDGEKKVTIHGEEIAVKAQIRKIDGYSAHADQSGLLRWATAFKTVPKRYFITHGEEDASLTFAKLLNERIGSARTVIPSLFDEYVLGDETVTVKVESPYQTAEEIRHKLNNLIEQELQQNNIEQLQRLLCNLNKIIEDYQQVYNKE
ncbi:MBL fold metallo-hydrolase RNA specificity domain-containing protein [Zhaonella formicivorans]|uniref:MBL fold metallo-hydrolase RNA specificity domain-containing protein n=1 Tax=Zhaonella formicivorans TaxID=2528593 RepID=UPI0010D883BC|nr:MBL fold metallo-hydrolase [Zhaonella formicivorans]